ncbi:helix-hairpin-helix domain-containing protein [Lihuaxuella thermophila]|uniref:Competence protein ComEA n=1 Tax=Lihuaxuella thermophila TaxID=1173111 RepID=A0A1H8D9A8_9BACL|nr:helix-hairpin-helix domain-containing protein [Lihuaxuella thermophila]SEN03424.1 competence protein ComEA [Lihuaxuella thermophila]
MIRADWTSREKMLGIGLALTIIILFSSFWWNGKESSQPAPLEPYQAMGTEKKKADTNSGENVKATKVIVDVKGAVRKPGIYELDAHSRVYMAVQKAGGTVQSADLNRVNLAGQLSDGMVVYIPQKGEEVPVFIQANKTDETGSASEKINVNAATVQELEQLDGIGASKAEAIVRYREEHGKFQSLDDLTRVPGIGEKILAKFRDQIIVQ